ncbi:MAG: hypothetical protein AAFR17_02745 [Pseudomonadota bacterium]
MRVVKLAAAAALILAPLQGIAQSTSGEDDDDQVGGTITEGGVAAEALPVIDAGSIPAGAYVVGGLVFAAGIAIAILAADGDSARNPTGAVNTTVNTN